MEQFVLALVGPTAVGKTDLILDALEGTATTVINMDSVQVYKDMDIGSGKPDATALQRVPHELLDLCRPNQIYSVRRFCEDARRSIARVRADARVPVLVGGTMLYLRALTQGLSELPAASMELRRELSECAREKGWAHMHSRLADCDPESAQKISPGDSQRIQRALEVYEFTGSALSVWQRENPPTPVLEQVRTLALVPYSRPALHKRIELRVMQMLEQGLVEETERLMQCYGYDPDTPAWRSVGYRQASEYLTLGKPSDYQLAEKIAAATRQLAKRQLTWINNWPGMEQITLEFDDKMRPASQNWDHCIEKLRSAR